MNDLITITTINNEPRVLDTDLAEALGMKRPRVIRELIERNREELEVFGSLPCHTANPGPQGGRPSKAFYLNEDQAVHVVGLSRTPKGRELRIHLTKMFNAWRRGERPSAQRQLPDFTNTAEAAAFALGVSSGRSEATLPVVNLVRANRLCPVRRSRAGVGHAQLSSLRHRLRCDRPAMPLRTCGQLRYQAGAGVQTRPQARHVSANAGKWRSTRPGETSPPGCGRPLGLTRHFHVRERRRVCHVRRAIGVLRRLRGVVIRASATDR